MIRFIWQNWWRHKERFILLLIGALIVSSGLSYLVGLSQTNKGTIVDALQKRWQASYDIVVRPPGSRSVTEDMNLLEPNYLSGISGGISLDQFADIRQIEEVEVAAPIAMIGYMGYHVTFKQLNITEPGVYRVRITQDADIGPRHQVDEGNFYFTVGPWNLIGTGKEYGVGTTDQKLEASSYVLLAGIDPQAEAKLVGLDDAVLTSGKSRYFEPTDESSSTIAEGLHKQVKKTRFPILMNSRTFVDETTTHTIERLDLPFDDAETAAATMETVKQQGGESYLDTVEAVDSTSYAFTSDQTHDALLKGLAGVDPETGQPVSPPYEIESSIWIAEKSGPLTYRPITSPFQQRWPFAYDVEIYEVDEADLHPEAETFRPIQSFGNDSDEWPRIDPYWIGFYDPGQLNISKDPLTELPMETYRPASATLVLDDPGEPINPPIDIKPTNRPFDFLTNPPGMLTTIEAAADILGDQPISAIRIKVAGVTDLSDASQQKLEQVAAEIEKKTGLDTDITLGSSPQPTLTHIPALGEQPALGWLQQPWVKIGSSIAIFRETKIGLSGIIGSVIAVTVVYVFATNLVSLLARRKQLAILLAVGWRPRQLAKMIVYEALLLGSFVALVAWTMLGVVLAVHDTETSFMRIALTGLFGLLVYGLGAVIPAILAMRISPYETMRTGEIARTSRRLLKTRNVLSMAVNYLFGKWKRALLSIAAIALPTSLLSFFIFITFRLKGVMYTTWLGQYVALEVGLAHYLAMGVALVIAILTTAEIMWQNVAERHPELALLKAVGWRNGSVRWLILWEGVLCGLFAGLLGLSLAVLLIWGMYREFPMEHLAFILSTGLIPLVAGLIGAVLPAEKATRVHPAHGVGGGQYANKKKTEKRLKWGVAGVCACLFLLMVTVLIQIAPEVSHEAARVNDTDPEVTPTTGTVTEKKEEGEADSETEEQERQGKIKDQMDEVNTEVLELGETLEYLGTEFTVEKMTEPPPDVDLEPPSSGMKYVSVQITMSNYSDGAIGYDHYKIRLQTNEGLISPSYFPIVKEKNYESNLYYLDIDGVVTSINIYEVPENANEFTLVFNPPYFAAVVEVPFSVD